MILLSIPQWLTSLKNNEERTKNGEKIHTLSKKKRQITIHFQIFMSAVHIKKDKLPTKTKRQMKENAVF